MIEPRRLRDEAESAVELLLLEAGTAYRSSPDARAKTLAALGLAGSAAVTAGVGVATSSLLSKLGWGKLLLISGLGAALVAPLGYGAWNRLHSGREETAKVVVSPPPTQVSTPPAVPKSAPIAAAAPAEDAAAAELAPADARAPIKDTKPATASDLAAELAALDAARAKLAAGDASSALAKLDDYSRTYPRGHLVLEAEVLRIDALAKNGQGDLAKKRAAAFLRRHPNSVLASRVRGYLD